MCMCVHEYVCICVYTYSYTFSCLSINLFVFVCLSIYQSMCLSASQSNCPLSIPCMQCVCNICKWVSACMRAFAYADGFIQQHNHYTVYSHTYCTRAFYAISSKCLTLFQYFALIIILWKYAIGNEDI